jgi:hypothetical protein
MELSNTTTTTIWHSHDLECVCVPADGDRVVLQIVTRNGHAFLREHCTDRHDAEERAQRLRQILTREVA